MGALHPDGPAASPRVASVERSSWRPTTPPRSYTANSSGIAPVFAEETTGIAPDPQSRIVSGRVLHPGYREEHARGHLVRRAMEHGVDPRRLPAGGRLPSNVTVFGIGDDGKPFHFGGWQPPEPPGRPRRFSRSLRRVIARK